jgi:hypothetical protein
MKVENRPTDEKGGNFMQAATAIFEQIRPLVSKLDEAERFALIRSIALLEPEAQADEATEEDETADHLRKEAAAWFARSKLERQQYQGEYVAIHNGEVVEHDLEQRALYLRVRQRFDATAVLLIHADWDALPEFTIHSVNLVRET